MADANVAFIASDAPDAQAALASFGNKFPEVKPEDADVIVAFGGDGFMLQAMHQFVSTGKNIYGMNRGSVGFLMNEYREDRFMERLSCAEVTVVHPLRMLARDTLGKEHESLAFNEVSLLRQTYQAAKLELAIDGRTRLDELICDGILLSTPAGSTAYNLSAHGPILPINSPLLALTPISAFRPRRWRGAILPCEAQVTIKVLESEKRPVSAVADHDEFRDVLEVHIREDQSQSVRLMFDEGHSPGRAGALGAVSFLDSFDAMFKQPAGSDPNCAKSIQTMSRLSFDGLGNFKSHGLDYVTVSCVRGPLALSEYRMPGCFPGIRVFRPDFKALNNNERYLKTSGNIGRTKKVPLRFREGHQVYCAVCGVLNLWRVRLPGQS